MRRQGFNSRCLRVWMVWMVLCAAHAGAQTIEVPFPDDLNLRGLQRQVDSSRLAGDDLTHYANQLLDAARSLTGGIPAGTQLVVPFNISSNQHEVQQHELTFSYTPEAPMVRLTLQYEDESAWVTALVGYGAEGNLFLSYGILAGPGTRRWRLLIEDTSPSSQLTYNLAMVRHEPVDFQSPTDVTVHNVTRSTQSAQFWNISGTLVTSVALDALAYVRAYIYDASDSLLVEESAVIGVAMPADGLLNFSILVTTGNTTTAHRYELTVFNRVNGMDVELSCAGCESRPWAENAAPTTAVAIPAQTLTVGTSATLDLGPYFVDSDPLTYSATSSALSIATVSVVGAMLTITPVAPGTATGTVTATDSGGLSATQSVAVTVTGGDTTSGREVTVSNVVFEHDTGSYYYAITGVIANSGGEALDGWTSWVRFYDANGALVVEEDERRRNRLGTGERTQFRVVVDREDTRGWAYFVVSLVADDTAVLCVGCDVRHVPPSPNPCGIPFDEAIAVTKQCSSGGWWASGPIQSLLTCWGTESEALDLVTSEDSDGFFLERIGTADYRRGSRNVTGARLWSAGYVLASYNDDLREDLSNISCTTPRLGFGGEP